jgi:hypothetical protein
MVQCLMPGRSPDAVSDTQLQARSPTRRTAHDAYKMGSRRQTQLPAGSLDESGTRPASYEQELTQAKEIVSGQLSVGQNHLFDVGDVPERRARPWTRSERHGVTEDTYN